MGRGSGEVIFLDVNVFVELFLEQERQEECAKLFAQIRDGKINAYTSDFVVFGSSLVLERKGKNGAEIKQFLEDVFNLKGLTVYDITPSDMIDATKTMKKNNLTLEDAYSVQGALANNIKYFVSFDKDFDNLKAVRRAEPRDLI